MRPIKRTLKYKFIPRRIDLGIHTNVKKPEEKSLEELSFEEEYLKFIEQLKQEQEKEQNESNILVEYLLSLMDFDNINKTKGE